jgi:hypothetical protein
LLEPDGGETDGAKNNYDLEYPDYVETLSAVEQIFVFLYFI